MLEALRLCRAGAFAAAALIAGLSAAMAQGEPIRIAFPSGMNGQIVVTMEKAGIAKKAGLDPQFASFQYGPPMMEALAAGSIDAVVTSLMPVTAYAAKLPGDVKVVAMLGQSSHSLMVGKESPVTDAAGLSGKKLGVSFGSDSHLDTLVWLKEIGLTDKVSLVNIAPPELATALANASVDAVVIRQPQVLRLQQQSGARIIKSWPFRFVSIVKTKYLQEHPKALEKYLAALKESLLYIATHHEETAAWFGEYLRISPEIVMAVSKDDPFYEAKSPSDIDISVTPAARELIAKWATDAYEQKMIRTKVDMGQLFQ